MLVRCLAGLLLAAGLAVGVAIAEEAAPAVDPEALAAARELIEVTGVSKQIDGMIASVGQGMAAGAGKENAEAGKKIAAEFEAVMQKFAGYKTEMLNDFAVLYAQNFTAAEMKEVANFYRSGTGAKFVSSMPMLMQKGSEIGMKYSRKLMDDMAAGKK